MTDPSSGDPAPDGGVSEESDEVDPDPVDDADPNPVDDADPNPVDDADGPARTGGSPGVAVATALLLGVLGPVIALASGVAVFAIDSLTGGLSLVASVVLTLVLGQYVAFGGLAVGYLAWRGFDREGIVSYLGVRVPSLKEVGIVLGSWVVILLLILVVSTVVQALGTETAANQSAELAMGNPTIIPLFIVASFLVIGPCEEILYRGVVQGRLRESLPAAPSILLSAAIFATIHVMALTGGLSARLTTVAILFVPSLVFGAVYEYTENLVVPALLHGLHNAVIFTVLYVSVTQVGPDAMPALLGGFPV